MLLFIFVSSRFVRYLADAASGRFSGEVVLSILLFRIPGFLELILPLALFLGVMLSYGRLYVDSEMVVLQACGVSKRRLLVYTQGPAMLVALLTALLSFWITPLGMQKFEKIWNDPNTYSGLGTLVAGSFKKLPGDTGVVYVSKLNQSKTELEDVFIAQTEGATFSVIRSDSGEVISHSANDRFLELQQGMVSDGVLGQKAMQIAGFGQLGMRLLKQKQEYNTDTSTESLSTKQLLQQVNTHKAKANLHWRLSLPLLAPIAAIIALALSETSHRRGRYIKILPGIILYIFYLSLFLASKSEIEKGQASPVVMWVVHGVFLAIGLLLLFFQELKLALRKSKMLRGGAL